MVSFDFASAIVFYILLFLLVVIKRKRLEFQKVIFPLLYGFLYKGNVGLNAMKKISDAFPRFWRGFGYVAIVFGFIGMAFILVFFSILTGRVITSGQPEAVPVIPGIPIPGAPITIPFWYGMSALIIAVFIHELCHGILSMVHDIKIKSSGVGIFALIVPLIPFAFVEPDEKELAKKSKKVQLSMIAAGPFANMVISVLMVLGLFLAAPLVESNFMEEGLKINEIIKESPAEEIGLSAPLIIYSINDEKIQGISSFVNITNSILPGDEVKLNTDKGDFSLTAGRNEQNESRGFIGVGGINELSFIQPKEKMLNIFGNTFVWWPIWLLRWLNWIFALNIALGLFNLLPLGPVDGGRMFRIAISRYFSDKTVKRVMSVLGVYILVLFVINFLPYFKPLFNFL